QRLPALRIDDLIAAERLVDEGQRNLPVTLGEATQVQLPESAFRRGEQNLPRDRCLQRGILQGAGAREVEDIAAYLPQPLAQRTAVVTHGERVAGGPLGPAPKRGVHLLLGDIVAPHVLDRHWSSGRLSPGSRLCCTSSSGRPAMPELMKRPRSGCTPRRPGRGSPSCGDAQPKTIIESRGRAECGTIRFPRHLRRPPPGVPLEGVGPEPAGIRLGTVPAS